MTITLENPPASRKADDGAAGPTTIGEQMGGIGRRARAAAGPLGLASGRSKRDALLAVADSIHGSAAAILAENARDLSDPRMSTRPPAFVDRARLDPGRLDSVALSVAEIADLPDPVGRVMARFERPNGLAIERVSTPLGVVGIIFESRPNVTADAAALCLMAGNAAILRSGSETLRTASALAVAIRSGLARGGLPPDAVQLVPSRDREAVGLMLAGLGGTIDVIVPRGGRSLVERVQADARVPVFAHLEGVCHVYVDGAADLAMARAIAVNSKMRRTGICGAAETLLVDRACAPTHLAPILSDLLAAGCEVRGDEVVRSVEPRALAATEADWGTEYLEAVIAVRVVDGIEGALAHIAAYGSNHTDAIVTGDEAVAGRFLAEVDSAIVLHNASTQFADGGEFGFGAEIGIATGRMHARGPVGVEQLTSFKYRVHGTGQTRPA